MNATSIDANKFEAEDTERSPAEDHIWLVQSVSGVEEQPLCLISTSGVKTLGSVQQSLVPSPVTVMPETLYHLPSKLYMMPEFSYCLSSRNTTTTEGSSNGHRKKGSEDEPPQ
ncbi:hypothetical protein TSMEX_004613 [Taenia solium]|eukprot:TsM_000576000 transcript=TsM_000576000 gene=TsM_000576000